MPQTPQQDDQRAAVQLQIKSDLIKVAPGNAESTGFTVKNLGTQVEEFRFRVTGPEWIMVEPAAMSVYPGQESSGALQAAPPRTPSSLAGVTPFQLTVISALHANVSSSAAGRVDIAPYYELAAELVPTSSSGSGLTRHDVTLDNRGNVPLRVALNATDVGEGLHVGVPAYADVPPGRVAQVPVSVRSSRRWFGRPVPRNFAVIAEAPKPLAATRLPGTRTVSAVFPGWVPAAAAGLVAVAVAGALVVPKLTAQAGPGPIRSSSAVSSTPATVTSTTPATVTSTTPVTASTTPVTASTTPVTVTTTPVTVTPTPSYDLTMLASSATWTSYDNGSPTTVTANTQTGCQAGAETDSQGAVFDLTQVGLEDNSQSQAEPVLETDPPSQPSASITGIYTFPATATQEEFRADVGFCSGVAAGAQMYYWVTVGTATQPQKSGTLDTSTGQLTPIDVIVPANTTQIELAVQNEVGTGSYTDVVWVDPRIEAQNATPPPARPTISPGLSPTPTT